MIGKTQFYRMKNETIGISPAQQRAIKKIFLKYGIETDPVFDRYEPAYPWKWIGLHDCLHGVVPLGGTIFPT